MCTGKEKCEILRRIRQDVAERYGLQYTPSECKHQGDCSGTCPKCDAELEDLQRQLESRGIENVDLLNIPIEASETNEVEILQGDIQAPPEEGQIEVVTMGMPAPPYVYKDKRRVLYKECQIAGITFHDLRDVWDELYEGAELALVREKDNKHDKYAIAVALADDYDGDPDDFDFDFILGYVPRSENKHLATMLDLGWAEAFECELSRVNGSNPYKGSLYMKIYMVSKDEKEIEDTSNLIRVLELDKAGHEKHISDLHENGCTYFRCGGFPPWEHKFPKRGEKVVFMYKEDSSTLLYLMHCIAIGDDDASYFVKDKGSLHAVDDCCYYVFTNIKGPIHIPNIELDFLSSEKINKRQPEDFLSEEASFKMKLLIANN